MNLAKKLTTNANVKGFKPFFVWRRKMYIFLILMAYFYLSIGAIIGFKLMSFVDKWYIKIAFILLMAFIWLPNLPADIIANNTKKNLVKKG